MIVDRFTVQYLKFVYITRCTNTKKASIFHLCLLARLGHRRLIKRIHKLLVGLSIVVERLLVVNFLEIPRIHSIFPARWRDGKTIALEVLIRDNWAADSHTNASISSNGKEPFVGRFSNGLSLFVTCTTREHVPPERNEPRDKRDNDDDQDDNGEYFR